MTSPALGRIRELADDLLEAEAETSRRRERLNGAIRAAVARHSQADVARAAGMSRQRVGQVVHGA